ncbi:MAG TPA: efflux RND transporter periplasmic adaptor subunit [Polyangiales bacterium]|nr:efflux RND transporter periplasmic adaptor subunit [Polyangiales bacterium]
MKAAWWLLLLVSCSEARPGPPKPVEARKVELARVQSELLGDQLEISGSLAAQDEVVVRTKVPGRLASLAVDLGSAVKLQQAIAQIEPVDYRLRVDQAEAALAQARALLGLPPSASSDAVEVDETTGVRLAKATLVEQRANYERALQLVDKKLIGRAEFESSHASFLRAESDVQRAREEIFSRMALLEQRKAELGLARQQLADTTIRAPLAGVVQLRSTTAGEFLAAGAAVATVVRIDPLRLRVAVPERDAAKVALGQPVAVQVEAAQYTGKVARLSPALDAQNRTLVIEAELPNPGDLRPGSFARATIRLGEGEPALAIPDSALIVFAGIEKVIVVEDGKAVERRIETGRRLRGVIEVTRGLAAGDQVVRVPGSLQHGDPVQVVDASVKKAAVEAPQLRVQ